VLQTKIIGVFHMVPAVAVKKDVLPRHAWQGLSGKERGREIKMPEPRAEMDSLPSWRRSEETGKQVMAAVANVKMAPRSRAEIDMWTARLLEENARLGNHSC